MNKKERIKRYGKDAYEEKLQQSRDWHAAHPEEIKASNAKTNPKTSQEAHHKGGKYYEKALKYQKIGLSGERHKIRAKHGTIYRPYKQIIAPNSQIHHEWIPGTADFRGVALVEMNPHQYGFIDVIQILEGEITLLTEEAIRAEATDR